MRPLRTAAARRGPAAAVALLAGAVLVGCAAETGARDDGVAPTLAPPASASPLWPGYSLPAVTVPRPEPTLPPPEPVEGVTVPAGGLRKVDVRTLLARDPEVPAMVRGAEGGDCPRSRCVLREPEYRDLTGDGEDELVLAIDELGFQLTVLQIYRAVGDTVRPVLTHYGQPGLSAETYGTDLVVTAAGPEGGLVTTRYRWNAELGRMNAMTPRDKPTAERPTPAETAEHPTPTGSGRKGPGT